jgi:hypothetical protein
MREIHQVGSRLEAVHNLLLSPAALDLDGCAGHLEEAVAGLRQVEIRLLNAPGGEPRGELEIQIQSVRSQLAGIRRLLDGAADFHQGWAHALAEAAGAATYDAAGSLNEPQPAGSVSLNG